MMLSKRGKILPSYGELDILQVLNTTLTYKKWLKKTVLQIN